MAVDRILVTPGSGDMVDADALTSTYSGTPTVKRQDIVIASPSVFANKAEVSALNALHVNLASSASLIPATGPTVIGTTLNSAVTATNVASAGNATVEIGAGTAVTAGLLIFEASPDGGTTWNPLDVTRSDGMYVGSSWAPLTTLGATSWNVPLTGFNQLRVRVASALTATTAPAVTIIPGPTLYEPSPAVALMDGNRETFTCFASGTLNGITDIMNIVGSASKIVRITRVVFEISGSVAMTATGPGEIRLLKRSTANTGGTSAAGTIQPVDTIDTASATSLVYSAAMTSGGTVASTVDSKMFLSLSAGWAFDLNFNFGAGRPVKCPILRGVNERFAVNMPAAITGASQVLTWRCLTEFTEE
jgi:hypothetical protein